MDNNENEEDVSEEIKEIGVLIQPHLSINVNKLASEKIGTLIGIKKKEEDPNSLRRKKIPNPSLTILCNKCRTEYWQKYFFCGNCGEYNIQIKFPKTLPCICCGIWFADSQAICPICNIQNPINRDDLDKGKPPHWVSDIINDSDYYGLNYIKKCIEPKNLQIIKCYLSKKMEMETEISIILDKIKKAYYELPEKGAYETFKLKMRSELKKVSEYKIAKRIGFTIDELFALVNPIPDKDSCINQNLKRSFYDRTSAMCKDGILSIISQTDIKTSKDEELGIENDKGDYERKRNYYLLNKIRSNDLILQSERDMIQLRKLFEYD